MSYVIADLHFGHTNMTRGIGDKPPMRAFESTDAMNEYIIDRWNKVITTNRHIVYVLGDVAMQRIHLPLLGRLQGRKILVGGNHDVHRLKDYLPYFSDIGGCKIYRKSYLLTHFPVHPSCLHRYKLNIHGHTHQFAVLHNGMPDPRYVNVCVEQTGYAPIPLDVFVDRKIL